MEFVEKKNLDFQNLKCLVFDGLDSMIEKGFESTVFEICHHDIMPKKGQKQVLLFCASIPTVVIHFSNFLENQIFLTINNTGRIENHFSEKCVLILDYILSKGHFLFSLANW